MKIIFNEMQIQTIKKHVAESVRAHHEEDCEFCGYRICIDIAPVYGATASLVIGNSVIDLGLVGIE